MAKIEIPESLRKNLGPEMKMDNHWVDVKLHNGRCYFNLVVRGGRYITGRERDNGESDLPFQSKDIKAIRRVSIPLWIFGPLWFAW